LLTLVPESIEEYAAAHTTAPDALLSELEAYTQANCADPQMLTGPIEGKLLAMLVAVTGAKRVLEVGCYTGYSALSMAGALPDDGVLLTCDRNVETARIAQSFFDRSPDGGKITLKLGEALDTIRALPNDAPFDMAFLDADKENYINYYELILPHLGPGGLVVADNVLWSGRVLGAEKGYDDVQGRTSVAEDTTPGMEEVESRQEQRSRMSKATRAIVAFNKHVKNDPRVEHVMLTVRDGVFLIRKL
jgi:caffeoyl-CoA O-methyltransferase